MRLKIIKTKIHILYIKQCEASLKYCHTTEDVFRGQIKILKPNLETIFKDLCLKILT